MSAFKLLQIGPYPPPLGGWSFHIKKFKEYLGSKGITNEVLNIGPTRRVKSPEYQDVHGFFDYAFKLLRYGGRNYLLYHHLNGDSIKGFALTFTTELIALLYGKKSVLNFHAGLHQRCFDDSDPLHKLMSLFVFKLAGEIICNSEEVRKAVIRNGAKQSKVHAIPCFSSQYLSFEKGMGEREARFIRNHNPVLTSYLFFRREFEVETLISAMRNLKQMHPRIGLIIVGEVKGSEQIRRLVKEYGLEDAVLFSGEQPHDEFLSILDESEMYIRTHIKDGVCSSVLEALSLGVPVVACDNGSRPEGVVKYKSRDHCDLVEKVDYILKNVNQMRDAVKEAQYESISGRDSIEEEFVLLTNL